MEYCERKLDSPLLQEYTCIVVDLSTMLCKSSSDYLILEWINISSDDCLLPVCWNITENYVNHFSNLEKLKLLNYTSRNCYSARSWRRQLYRDMTFQLFSIVPPAIFANFFFNLLHFSIEDSRFVCKWVWKFGDATTTLLSNWFFDSSTLRWATSHSNVECRYRNGFLRLIVNTLKLCE